MSGVNNPGSGNHCRGVGDALDSKCLHLFKNVIISLDHKRLMLCLPFYLVLKEESIPFGLRIKNLLKTKIDFLSVHTLLTNAAKGP